MSLMKEWVIDTTEAYAAGFEAGMAEDLTTLRDAILGTYLDAQKYHDPDQAQKQLAREVASGHLSAMLLLPPVSVDA